MHEDLNAVRFECPTSGVLLGVIVKSFNLDDEDVGGKQASKHLGSDASYGKSARRYFHGDWVSEEKRKQICRYVVDAALHAKLIDGNTFGANTGLNQTQVPQFLAEFLFAWLAMWDGLYRAGAAGWPCAPRQLSMIAIGRPLVIDLALRVSAIIQLTNACKGEDVVLFAGLENSGKELLNALNSESGKSLTRSQLARALELEKSTVDDWYDKSTVPQVKNIKKLAQVFASATQSAANLERWLLIQFGAIAITERLKESVGSEFAPGFASALSCFIQWTLSLHAQSQLPLPVFRLGQVETLILGGDFRPSSDVLNSWLSRENNPWWFDDIFEYKESGPKARIQQCFEIIGDWPMFTTKWDTDPLVAKMPLKERRDYQLGMALALVSPKAIGFSEILQGEPPSGAPPCAWWSQRAIASMQQQDYRGALTSWEKAIAADATNAEYRCYYAISLWKAIPNPEFDKALDELNKAIALRPGWDYPRAEIVRIYVHRGYFERALQFLNNCPKELVDQSQDCCFMKSQVLLLLKRPLEAKECARLAYELDPNHAEAWDIAAECEFLLGEKVAGARCAREALRLGQSRSYNRWVRPMSV